MIDKYLGVLETDCEKSCSQAEFCMTLAESEIISVELFTPRLVDLNEVTRLNIFIENSLLIGKKGAISNRREENQR